MHRSETSLSSSSIMRMTLFQKSAQVRLTFVASIPFAKYHFFTDEQIRPRKRFRTDAAPRDKFNLSNDQYYEVAKDGGRHRVRQTFGQLTVEHAYSAQKLQLPFVRFIPGLLWGDQVNINVSTKRDFPSKKLVPSIGPHCNSPSTSSSISRKSGLRRKKRTKLGVN